MSRAERINTLYQQRNESSKPADAVSQKVKDYIEQKVSRLLKNYPRKMKSWLAPIAYTFSTTSEFDGFGKELRFSTFGLDGDLDQANKAIMSANKKGFAVGGDDEDNALLALIVHEFGHAVNMFIIDYADEDLQDEWFAAKKALLKEMPYPSKYSRQNSREHFAELYVLEVLYDGKGKLWELIEKFIEKLEV